MAPLVAGIERGHARLLCLDCSPEAGGVRVGRMVAEADFPEGTHAGFRIVSNEKREPVLIHLPQALTQGMYRDFLLGVTDEQA